MSRCVVIWKMGAVSLELCVVTASVPCSGTELILLRLSVAASVPKVRHLTNRKAPVALESFWVL